MRTHPSPEDLAAFLEGRLEGRARGRLVSHLVQGCEECREFLKPGFAALLETEWLSPEPDEAAEAAAHGEAGYDEAVDRSAEAVLLHGTRALERKKKVRRLLARLKEKGRDALDVKRQGNYVAYEALLAYSWQLRHDDPAEMVFLARTAVLISTRLDKDSFTDAQAMDLQARAEAEYANALRVADRLPEAEARLDQAFSLAALGTGSSRLALRLQDLKASLLGTQHRYAEAVALLDRLHAARLTQGDRHGAGRALIMKGIYAGRGGDPAAALRLLEEGAAILEPGRDPDLERQALHNRLYFLAATACFEPALQLVGSHGPFLLGGGRLDECKLFGIAGRIFAGLGMFDLAEDAFRAAKAGFEALGVKAHAALLGLDLATIVLRRGRSEEARMLAAEAVHEFAIVGVPDQRGEALLVLSEALKAELLSVGLLESVADFLRRSEHDPQARYEPRFG